MSIPDQNMGKKTRKLPCNDAINFLALKKVDERNLSDQHVTFVTYFFAYNCKRTGEKHEKVFLTGEKLHLASSECGNKVLLQSAETAKDCVWRSICEFNHYCSTIWISDGSKFKIRAPGLGAPDSKWVSYLQRVM